MINYLSEADLERLIDIKLKSCEAYHNVCELIKTKAGKNRIITRVKEILFLDGIVSIETALANIETELIFS